MTVLIFGLVDCPSGVLNINTREFLSFSELMISTKKRQHWDLTSTSTAE